MTELELNTTRETRKEFYEEKYYPDDINGMHLEEAYKDIDNLEDALADSTRSLRRAEDELARVRVDLTWAQNSADLWEHRYHEECKTSEAARKSADSSHGMFEFVCKERDKLREELESARRYIHALENAERGDAESEHHLSGFREDWQRFGGCNE